MARAQWSLQVVVRTGRAPLGRLRIRVCLCGHVWVCACDPCVQVSAWGTGNRLGYLLCPAAWEAPGDGGISGGDRW